MFSDEGSNALADFELARRVMPMTDADMNETIERCGRALSRSAADQAAAV